jgi:hypothetical protein
MDINTTQRPADQAQNMIAIACRGTALLLDMQMEAMRNLCIAQARTAQVFGAPDYSSLFTVSDEKAKTFFSGATDQMLASSRQAVEIVNQMNQQVGRLFEQQTSQLTEGIRSGIEQLGRQTQQGLDQMRQTVQQASPESERHIIPASSDLGTSHRPGPDAKRPSARTN